MRPHSSTREVLELSCLCVARRLPHAVHHLLSCGRVVDSHATLQSASCSRNGMAESWWHGMASRGLAETWRP